MGLIVELTVLGCSGSYGGAGRRRVQRLPAAVRRHVDLGRLRQRHVRPPAGAPRGRGPHRGRAHPRAPRPLRRHLRAPRAPALRPRASRTCRCSRPKGSRSSCCRSCRDWGNAFDWRAVGDGDTAEVGDIDLRFSRTDHPPPTYAVEATRRRQAADLHRRHRARAGRVGAFEPGADLVLSEATYLHDSIPAPIHLSAKQAGEAAREARAQRLILTHLWPHDRPAQSRPRRAAEAFGGAVTLAAQDLVTTI